mgnify:CR=1 FL=1
MPEEKMQENLNVFLRSSFFVPLLKRMTGQKDELPDEGAGKYQEISREMQREEEKKQEQDPKAQPQEEAQPQVSYREERQVVEQVGATGVAGDFGRAGTAFRALPDKDGGMAG